MNKMNDNNKMEDELRPEYEEGFWEGAVRGKYVESIQPSDEDTDNYKISGNRRKYVSPE